MDVREVDSVDYLVRRLLRRSASRGVDLAHGEGYLLCKLGFCDSVRRNRLAFRRFPLRHVALVFGNRAAVVYGFVVVHQLQIESFFAPLYLADDVFRRYFGKFAVRVQLAEAENVSRLRLRVLARPE